MEKQTTQSLLQLISEASFLTDEQKGEFMKLAKTANKKVYDEMVVFFSDAQAKIMEIRTRYEDMRKKMYQAYLSHIKSTLTEARSYISSTLSITPHDEQDESIMTDSLLNGLTRILQPSKISFT